MPPVTTVAASVIISSLFVLRVNETIFPDCVTELTFNSLAKSNVIVLKVLVAINVVVTLPEIKYTAGSTLNSNLW